MIGEFFGDLERLAADLYPYRWPITFVLVAIMAGVFWYGYRRGWHNIVRRHRLLFAVVGTPTLILIGFVGYDLGSPLFINVAIEEEFPLSHSADVPEGMKIQDVELVMEMWSQIDHESTEEMPDMPDVIGSTQGGVEMSPEATPTPIPAPTIAAPTPTVAPGPELTSTLPAAPLALKTGNFMDQDSFHKGSGQATIYELPDGTHLLRLENLKVTNGPDLHVILTPHQSPSRQTEVKTSGYADLGELKGNIGNQNYPIPVDVGVGVQQSVVIYCKPFHVVFSVASLS